MQVHGRSSDTMLVISLLSCVLLTVCHGVNGKKNVLILLADDGGFQMPCYGDQQAVTPNLAKLATQGAVFDRAYTSVSSCSPSRASLLSGMPTHQNGMFGLAQPPGRFESFDGVQGLPNLLEPHGYKTGILGKYHVNPMASYNFTYGLSEPYCWSSINTNCKVPYNTVARNVTYMKEAAHEFLNELEPDKPFLLYVGFGDTHRCKFESEIGSFCEFYGSGERGQGVIPDWKPVWFDKDKLPVPSFLPDNAAVREDLAAMYTAYNRLDRGVGLLIQELESAGVLNDTLIIFSSDNGMPFPSGKTNLAYEQGHGEPFIVWTAELAAKAAVRAARAAPHRAHASHNMEDDDDADSLSPLARVAGQRISALVSLLDIMPTVLDWTGVPLPSYPLNGYHVSLTGTSVLPLLYQGSSSYLVEQRRQHTQQKQEQEQEQEQEHTAVFGSHQFHSLYLYYPMRVIRSNNYRMTHNIAHHIRYGILDDVYTTKTWQNILKESAAGQPTGWVYNLTDYLFRPEYTLCDVSADPLCLHNLAYEPSYQGTLTSLQTTLLQWRNETHDPWLTCHDQPGFCSQ